MDALDELTNMYGSSQGSANFNQLANPSMSRFDNNEGGNILHMYPGQGQPDFGYPSPERNRNDNFINNDIPRPYTGGRMADDTASFDKYSAQGRHNEPYEDILDSIKGDTYDKKEDRGRFRGPPPINRPYTGPGQDYDNGRGFGPTSVEAVSIPDFDRSQVSSRDEDLRSMQPQNFRRGAPSFSKPSTGGNRGVSTGEDKRRSKFRDDASPGAIEVIETPASRRMKTADARNMKQRDKDDVPIFLAKKPGYDGINKPPLHKHVSALDHDDKFSNIRRQEGPRSGRFRDNKDDVSDVSSRRGFGQEDSYKGNSGVPALESSGSRRSGKYITQKTPGFAREDHDAVSRRAVSLSISLF
jgi:hypothetical protein